MFTSVLTSLESLRVGKFEMSTDFMFNPRKEISTYCEHMLELEMHDVFVSGPHA
jgi:hypothetical protein